MKQILLYEDIKNLKIGEPLYELVRGEVRYYRFLCFHPRNENYVILLNHCEEPVRVYKDSIYDRFFLECSQRDIITYRRDYFTKQAEECEMALSMLNGKDNMEDCV